jgi:hypothetical protein
VLKPLHYNTAGTAFGANRCIIFLPLPEVGARTEHQSQRFRYRIQLVLGIADSVYFDRIAYN